MCLFTDVIIMISQSSRFSSMQRFSSTAVRALHCLVLLLLTCVDVMTEVSAFLVSAPWMPHSWTAPCPRASVHRRQQLTVKTQKSSSWRFALFGELDDKRIQDKDRTPQELLEQARILREEIKASQLAASQRVAKAPQASIVDDNSTITTNTSPWSLSQNDNDAPTYRFYVNIGREEGTWMEPRWGASGQRIEFTVDVAFTTQPVTRQIAQQMVQDNNNKFLFGSSSSSSQVFRLNTAPFARLRDGFDRMECQPGAFRIDTNMRGQKTLRLFFYTQGKTFGDVSISENTNLYISLPVLADSSLSRKEGIVSIRQYGFKTGWYRLESRIVGVVKAVPIADALAKDGY
jgi:hypothetical protein